MNMLIDGAMLHEEEIIKLYDYLDRYLRLPDPIREEEFKRVSCQRWAVEEIIQILSDFPTYDAELLVEQYIITMRLIAERKGETSELFELAADIAEELLEKVLN